MNSTLLSQLEIFTIDKEEKDMKGKIKKYFVKGKILFHKIYYISCTNR